MKLKRLFTAILSAALTLSLCAMPAMADDTGTTTGTLSKTATTIDWKNQKGSLTIHKYETKNAPAAGAPTDDGETSTVIDGKPLNGVSFTLYKVKDDVWLKDYYQGTGTPTAMPKVSDYTINSDGTVQKGSDTFTAATTVITGDSSKGWAAGTAVASGLDLGLYLVVETDKPDAVKETTEPFLVSIPMTSVDTTNWLYDVTVNPKNVTKYGAATLKKVGYTGSEPDGTVMSGYTFKLYKLISGAWVQITNKPKNGQDNMGTELGTSGILTTNTDGKISVEDLTKGVYAFVETGVNSKQGYILDADTAYVFKLDADGAMKKATDLDVAETHFGTETKALNYDCVKPTTAGTNNLEVINYKPDFTKKATTRKGDSTATSTDYAIGDTVPFVLTIKVPENIAKLKTFTVTDKTDKNQLLHTRDVVVTDTAGAIPLTGYTINYEADGSGFTIDFKDASLATKAIDAYAGKTITITYSATLQPGAAVVDGIADTVNKNSAELKYSNKTTVDSKPESGDPYTIHEEAAVYTFKAGIHKTDGAGHSLDEVKFDLYKKFDANTDKADGADGVLYKGGHVAFVDPAEATRLGLNDASHTTGTTDKWYKIPENLKTDNNGYVVAKGLPKGTYKFVETQTKKDYNLLSKPVDADLNIDYVTSWSTDTTYNTTTGTTGTKKHSVTSTSYAGYTYKDIEVINRKGFTLPVTGGFGTLLFSGIGLLLVLVGVSVLFSLKKKTNRA